VGEAIDQPWIRSYALAPRRLSQGGWVWLRAYEWRWERPNTGLPNAINPPRISTRRAGPRKAPRPR
jgi:hypothetical protein